MPEGIESIWENWRHGSGPCDGCPMRDSNLTWEPYFGDGVIDADIAIIAETPGQGSSRRVAQNAPKPDLDVSSSLSEKLSRRNNNEIDGEDEVGQISFDLVSDRRIPRRFFEMIDGTFREDLNDRRRIYFTNAKKCKDIISEESEWKNGKGYIHCRSYIRSELDIVGPDLVLPLGQHATDLTFHELDSEWTGKLKSEIPIDFGNGLEPLPDKVRRVEGYHVVPSYHWNYINQSGYERQQYWENLARTITGAVV